MTQLPTSLVFATQNVNKRQEIQALLGDRFRLLTLEEVGITHELEENQPTLTGNALQKARFVAAFTGQPCFADDTGLEVEALDGAPGVFSARYAGEQRDMSANIAKLLVELAPHANRRARFRTVIAWVDGEEEHVFEGIVTGEIGTALHGSSGFGYDPVFYPEGAAQTFAQMTMAQKNAVSHRARAFAAFTAWLREKK